MNNVNLMELYERGIVKEGGHNISVPIKKANGEFYSGKTYAIPLEYLYYNDQNGRIGVSLSDYESENDKLESGHNEEYNMIIQNILTDSDETVKKNMNALKRDIYMKGQGEPGYVLNDGRVIDGNRRFTAKRLLNQDTSVLEPQYFEAVILNDLSVQNHNDMKKIKSLELQIQFGKIDKVDYNPIDKAIDAYKTVVKKNLMNAKEYGEYAGLTPTEVSKLILEAELIVKFLEFANASPDNYALAKQLDLDGPLQDMVPQYKKIKESPQLTQKLNSLFAKIIQIRSTREDFKTEFRPIVKNIIGSKNEKDFIDEMEDATDTIVEILNEKKFVKNNVDLFETLHNNKEAVGALAEVKRVSADTAEQVKNAEERNRPLVLINKAKKALETIEIEAISNLPKIEKEKLKINLKKIEEIIKLIAEENN